jgi:hypothetical protein
MKAFLVSNTPALSNPVLLRQCPMIDSPLVDQINNWLRELIEPKPNKWRNAFLQLAREGCLRIRSLTALEVEYNLSGVFARPPAIAFYNAPPKDKNWYGFHDRNAHGEVANTLFLHASFASGYDRILKMNPVEMLRNLPILLEVVKAKVYRLAAHWFVYKVRSKCFYQMMLIRALVLHLDEQGPFDYTPNGYHDWACSRNGIASCVAGSSWKLGRNQGKRRSPFIEASWNQSEYVVHSLDIVR